MKYYRLTKVLVLSCLVVGMTAMVPACDTADNDDDDNMNLRDGAVFSMSNARSGNTVVAYNRAEDGTLTLAGSFDTGGTG